MAKKQYRKVKTDQPVVNSTAAASHSPRTRFSSAEFNPDYTYVKQDLKRIGILAGSFIGVLVILSFFLR
jgi:hypothetical protein